MKMIVEKIDRLILDRGLRQAEVERLCGLAENRISIWKAGKGEPTARQALRLADLLRVPIRYLADDTMDSPQLDLDESQRRLLFVAEGIGYDEAAKLILTCLRERVIASGDTDWKGAQTREQNAAIEENRRRRRKAAPKRAPSKKPRGTEKTNG